MEKIGEMSLGKCVVSRSYFVKSKVKDCKVASSNTSCLKAHAGFFRLLMKGIFDTYVLFYFSTRDSTRGSQKEYRHKQSRIVSYSPLALLHMTNLYGAPYHGL